MSDVVLEALEKRWFSLAKQEDYPNTPDITDRLDKLTLEIRSRKNLEVPSREAGGEK